MKESIEINYVKCPFEALDAMDKALVEKAQGAMQMAHAPYSNFHVGSAVRLSDGHIVTGNNQENAAYPSGLCAERVALFAARSQSREAIETIAIVARNHKGQLADAFACGACRQVMMEYASLQDSPIRVIMGHRLGDFLVLADSRLLLPFHFEADTLN